MLGDMTEEGAPTPDRRALPRHLRDTEHDGVRDTAASGIRRSDAAGGGRGLITLAALLVLAAIVAWYVLSN